MNPNDKVLKTIGGIREVYGQSGDFIRVLEDLTKCGEGISWALCGAMAMGFHKHVRSTEDIDILVGSQEELDKLKWNCRILFKSNRAHAMVHKGTQIEVEILTPEFMKRELTAEVFESCLARKEYRAVGSVQVPIVNLISLIGLKSGRAVRPRGMNLEDDAKSDQDLADIQRLILNNQVQDISDVVVSKPQERELLDNLMSKVKNVKGFCVRPKR